MVLFNQNKDILLNEFQILFYNHFTKLVILVVSCETTYYCETLVYYNSEIHFDE